jgi:hypothetical protein
VYTPRRGFEATSLVLDTNFIAGTFMSITKDASANSVRFDVSGVNAATIAGSTSWTFPPSTVASGSALIGNLLVNYGVSGSGNPSTNLYAWNFQTPFKAGTVPLVFVECAGGPGIPDIYHASLTGNSGGTPATITNTGVTGATMWAYGIPPSVPQQHVQSMRYLAIGIAA